MGREFQKIIDQYHYSEAFGVFLYQVYKAFVEEMGDIYEPIIYEAFLNTDIVNCQNIYDYLKEQDLLDSGNDNLVSESDLRRSNGIYQSVPKVVYDENTGSYVVESVRRVVAVRDFDLSQDYTKASLIHELGHLIKSYFKEYQILDDILVQRSGLIETREKMVLENGKVKRVLISEKGVGLEEGFNSLLEEKIAKRIVNENYRVSGYEIIQAVVSNLLEMKDIEAILYEAQILDQKFKFSQEIGEEYEHLEIIGDRIYSLSLKMFSEIFDPEKMQKTSSEITQILGTEYQEILKNIQNGFNRN